MIALLARVTGVSPLVIEAVVLGVLLLAFVGVGFKIYDAGYVSADSKCQAAALQSQLEAVVADRDNARSAAADAALKLAAVQAQTKDEQERTAEYVAELAKQPAPGCALTDADLHGMRVEPEAKPRTPRKRPSGVTGWFDGARSRAAPASR